MKLHRFAISSVWVMALTAALAGPAAAQDIVDGAEEIESPDRNTGGDGTRWDAREMPIERTLLDNVDFVDGDMHDWKYFRIPFETAAELVVNFDNPAAQGCVVVYDNMQVEIARLENQTEATLEVVLQLSPGIYYLEFFARAESSDYIFEVNLQHEP